ncbi:MAG: GIY-YIG nuclease family protein [Candidatus Acidiferrum sp.]
MALELKHVYCYKIGAANCYRVGRTKNQPEKRKRGWATGSPARPTLYRDVLTENPSSLEAYVHHLLDAKRTENGEFFNVTSEELDDAINEAEAFMTEYQPLLGLARKLRRKKPTDAMVDPPDEVRAIYTQLRDAIRESFPLNRRVELLQSKIQVAIGDNRGMNGVASWKWEDRWEMDVQRFRKEQAPLYEKYKRDSGRRVFRLERVDLTKSNA